MNADFQEAARRPVLPIFLQWHSILLGKPLFFFSSLLFVVMGKPENVVLNDAQTI
jgi:hypothetical protein